MFKINSQKVIALFVALSIPSIASLGIGGERIWRQANNPANYVVIEEFDKSDNPAGMVLNHPYEFDPKLFTDMLLSVRYNKDYILRKDIKDKQVFFDIALVEKTFVPRIVEAFKKATPNQVVVFSIVQKDPYVVVRNDRLNIVRAFVAQDGLHLNFVKADAKLYGDYKAHTTGRSLIDSAKGLRVTLEPQPGQKLALNNMSEIVLDLNYDFAAWVDQKAAEDAEKEREEKERKRKKKEEKESKKKGIVAETQTSRSSQENPSRFAREPSRVSPEISSPSPSTEKQSPIDRLTELKQLKQKGLISDKEYEEKRKEILNQL